MRALSLLILLGISGVSSASFDMMLIPSNNTTSIHRYDPVNNVNLGSFTSNAGQITSVAGVSASSGALITGATGAQIINYNTGERIRSASQPNGIVTLNDVGTHWTEFSALGNRRIGTIDPLAGNSGISVGMAAGNSVVMTNSTTAVVMGRNAAGDIVACFGNPFLTTAFSPLTTIIPSSDVVAGSQSGQMAVFTVGVQKRIGFVYRSIAATNGFRLITFQINSDGTLPGSVSTNFTNMPALFDTTNVATTVAVVAGHDGAFAVGADTSGTGTRIVELGGSLGINMGNSTLNSAVTAPVARRWHMSNVVAPEPGTMAVLGLGAAALLRRRKR